MGKQTEKRKVYNHAYSFGFSLESFHPEGTDLTAGHIRLAIMAALAKTDDIGVMENVSYPHDTYEVGDK